MRLSVTCVISATDGNPVFVDTFKLIHLSNHLSVSSVPSDRIPFMGCRAQKFSFHLGRQCPNFFFVFLVSRMELYANCNIHTKEEYSNYLFKRKLILSRFEALRKHSPIRGKKNFGKISITRHVIYLKLQFLKSYYFLVFKQFIVSTQSI